MKLVASMIVKNELGRYLEPCIAHLQEFCDEIVVVDDASTDGTFEWLSSQEKVSVMQIPHSEGFFDGHEGRRRQYLLDYTLEARPNYVLSIDADEFVADGSKVREAVDINRHMLYTLEMKEVWEMDAEELRVRQDGGWRPHPVPILWRADRGGKLTIRDRALACGREPEQISTYGRAAPTGTDILHFGWANPETRQERYDRYVVADGGRFHASKHLDSILWTGRAVRLYTEPWPAGLSYSEGSVRYDRADVV